MELLRYRAFTTEPWELDSGNPAGVVLHADLLGDQEMLRQAAELGYSETAFLTAVTSTSARVRYFTPRAEIAFCGHATIASGVAMARSGSGPVVVFTTNAGEVPVEVSPLQATLTAVDTTVHPLNNDLLSELLLALRLTRGDLDLTMPPALIRGGNPHPLILVREGVLAGLDHDADAVLELQDRQGWDGTIPVVQRIDENRFVSRNPFPRGGIREDPATGSAAAGLGSYLRAGRYLRTPASITIEQGFAIGRPSRLVVSIPASGRIQVTGTAEPIV